jgi:hypothetical protein
MRANQPMGLSPAAERLVNGKIAVESGQHYEGYWGESFALRAWLQPTGELGRRAAELEALRERVATLEAELAELGRRLVAEGGAAYVEYEQDVVYSSGPCMFLALRDAAGQPVSESLWSDCAMYGTATGSCGCAGELCQEGCALGCRAAADCTDGSGCSGGCAEGSDCSTADDTGCATACGKADGCCAG